MNKIILFFKGIFMGAADIIPGVSGGSIALITGIYDEFLDAIHSVDLNVVKDIFSGRFKEGIKRIHWGFILPVVGGILTSVLSMARLMNYLLEEQQLYTWSLFFGLILASAFIISRQFKMNIAHGINVIIGAVSAFIIVGLVPIATPNDLWFIFLSGAIAICAMILPGISGAFLLLILGKYHYITGLLKDPFADNHFIVIGVFVLGCLVGILSFSRVLRMVLSRYHNGTMAFLTGMMLGSLRKIWPYKEAVASKIIDGELYVTAEKLVLPWNIEGSFLLSLCFVLLGVCLIILLDFLTGKQQTGKLTVNE